MAKRALVMGSQRGGLPGVHGEADQVKGALGALGLTVTTAIEVDASCDGIVERYRGLIGTATELGAPEHKYGRAFATRSSRRDGDSLVDHLRDIAEVHGGEDLAELAQRLDGRP